MFGLRVLLEPRLSEEVTAGRNTVQEWVSPDRPELAHSNREARIPQPEIWNPATRRLHFGSLFTQSHSGNFSALAMFERVEMQQGMLPTCSVE